MVNKNIYSNIRPFLQRSHHLSYQKMKELHKVVHVMRRLVPERWGGTEGVVYHISRELIRQGVDCRIHCTAMFAPPGRDTMMNVPVFRYRYRFPWFGLSEEARQALRLKGGSPLSLSLFWGLMREKDASIIHTHVQHRLGGMARTAARLKGIPCVVSLHGGYFTLPQEQIDQMTQPFIGKLEWGKAFGALFGSRRVLDDADAIICVGQAEYDEVQCRFPDKTTFLLPNGVDVQYFADAEGGAFRKAYGFGTSDPIVLCVSRIDPQKNQLDLVRAFSRFAKAHPEHRLVLLGPVAVEAYRAEIDAEIIRMGLSERVRIVEGLCPDDPLLPSAYKAADLFVLPSVHEPFGMVVLEAWAAGVPVLASHVGGIAGFAVDRETALLVEPGNVDQLAAGMAELAASDTLCGALVHRAYEEVQAHYDWSMVTGRLRSIYEQIILAH